jgi:hypothetical protein
MLSVSIRILFKSWSIKSFNIISEIKIMSYSKIWAYCLIIPSLIIALSSCKDSTTTAPIVDSLDPIYEVTLIPGSENTTITVNRSNEYYFTLDFRNIKSNKIMGDNIGEGWCIDWQKPIDSGGGVYNNIKLYSTFNVENWNPLNYLLNIKEQLKESDPGITNLELQIAIWSLRGFPEFNLNKIAVQDLPGRMHNDGQLTFDSQKVNQILQIVENGHKDFSFDPGTKFAVIAETPADVQTIITVVQ